jgi:hypothetical protein
VKKMIATMKTTPATMPTHAAAVVSRLRRSMWVGGGGGAAVATGPVVASEGVSLMHPMMQAAMMCVE